MANQKLIIIRGYPASGKSAVGLKLQMEGHGTFIDHNYLVNAVCTFTENDQGLYDAIRELELEMTRKMIEDGKSPIVARGFHKQSHLEPYLELASKAGIAAIVVRAEVPKEALHERVKAKQYETAALQTPEDLQAYIAQHPMETHDGEVTVDSSDPAAAVKQITDTLPS